MKPIKWPSEVKVPLDKSLGPKLDEVCEKTHLNRAGALRRGLELLYDQVIRVGESERSA